MRLQVTVRLADEIVEDTVLTVTDGLRLGEHERATVAFPGLDVVLSKDADDDVVVVRGHRLRAGESYCLSHGEVSVTLVPVAQSRLGRNPLWRGDIALPVLLLAVILATLSAQALQDVLHANADVSEGVARGVEALLLPESLRTPADEPPVVQPSWTLPERGFDVRYQE